jgi:Flp pilus assembly pilin Flp
MRFSDFKKQLVRFARDEDAPSVIEYALLTAGVAVIIIAVVYMLGSNASSTFNRAAPPSPTDNSGSTGR